MYLTTSLSIVLTCLVINDAVNAQECLHDGKLYRKGESRKEDCNTCYCGENGMWACTLMACLPIPAVQVTECFDNGQSYKVGATRKEDCNTCFCADNGEWACTIMACIPTTTIHSEEGCFFEGNFYKKNESRKDNCNTCVCTPDGTASGIWGCTKLACTPKVTAASVLKEIEIEGNILFSGNLPETMPTGSCLIITVESLLSTCDQGKGCTPRANATKIIKDVKITDDKLGYEVEINPNTLPDSYSIVVIFNVGWCSLRDKQQPPRTRPGDFQNAYVHEVHVDKHKEEYMKNILVTQVPLVYKDVIIYGSISLTPPLLSDGLGVLSCLVIQVTENIQCQNSNQIQAGFNETCNIPILSTLIVKKVPLSNSQISYRITMPFTKTGQYSIGATLNNGWCQENENNTWIKHGDYHNDQMVLVDVEKPGAEIQNNFDITVYSPPKESMPPPADIPTRISGLLIFNPPRQHHSSSCLLITVKQHKQCTNGEHCNMNTPVLASRMYSNISMNESVPYDIELQPPVKAGKYKVSAFVNIGWCYKTSKTREWLRQNDYITFNDHIVNLTGDKVYKQDLDLIRYQHLKPAEIIPELRIFGSIEVESLPSNEHSYTLPKDSCLRITFGSPLFCHPGGLCNATATEIIHSAQVENGRIPYSIKVKNVMPGLYRLGVNLRMGSCDQNQRGDDWLKENCYKRQVQTITVPESKSEMSEDLKIHEFEDSVKEHVMWLTNYDDDDYFICRCNGLYYADVPSPSPTSKDKSALTPHPEIVPSIYGSIILRPEASAKNIPLGSCLVLEAFEDLQCHGPEDCKLLQVANLTMQDPVIKDGRIPYYITLPATIQDGKYGISATLNTGWCQNEHSKKWVKYGDYHNTIAATVFIFDKKKSYKKDIYVDLYKEPTKGQDVKVHGDVHLEPAVSQDRSDIPAFSSSCLTVDLRELILCKKDEYCNIPISGRVVQRGFTIQRGSFIPYSMDVSEVKPGTYTISAVLNVGWCHHNVRGKRWIQEGDYLNVHGNEVEISNSSTRVRKDIYLTKYKTPDFRKAALEVNQTKPNHVIIKGNAVLTEQVDDIPNKSCLSVTIRENILCQDDSIYCEIPEVASLIIRNVTITKSKIPFEVALIPRPSAGPYTISVVLNLGWCQKDASDGTWIKPGDYHNTVAHEFEVRELEDEIEKDVSLEKLKPLPTTDPCMNFTCNYYGICKSLANSTAVCGCIDICTMIYEPVCGSDGKSYANLCVMKSEACTQKKMLTVKHEGSCDSPAKSDYMEVNVEIQFENGTRPRFSSASCVVIRVEDISRQDVSSKLLIEQLFPVAEVRPGAPIKFKVLSDKPDKDATDVSVSATLHFGHCTRRLRDGDYFTDTNYFLNISNPAKSVHDIKIFMLKFESPEHSKYMEVNIDIEFESNLPPASFPSNSCIALRVEDISIVDAPSQLLGEIKIPVENLDPKQPLTFKLFSDKPDEDATDVAAAATLHLGHCSGQLKTGDYITDTNYVLNITEKTKSVHDIRILLKKFVTDPCSTVMCEYYSFCKVMNNKSTACVCNQACPLNYEPVCGSDGRTYANECVMKSEACNNQKMIIVKHQGTCKPDNYAVAEEILVNKYCTKVKLIAAIGGSQISYCQRITALPRRMTQSVFNAMYQRCRRTF